MDSHARPRYRFRGVGGHHQRASGSAAACAASHYASDRCPPGAAYELAGHRTIALTQGFTADEADALTAGYASSTLAPAEQLAASATQCLLAGGALPQPLYDELLQTFGPHGPVHLCSIVGQYLFLSVTLNTFDVPVPD